MKNIKERLIKESSNININVHKYMMTTKQNLEIVVKDNDNDDFPICILLGGTFKFNDTEKMNNARKMIKLLGYDINVDAEDYEYTPNENSIYKNDRFGYVLSFSEYGHGLFEFTNLSKENYNIIK